MKRTIMILLTFILIFTTFIPPHTAYSEEAEDYCESMSFTIQTVRAGDIKIDGEASPDSEIEVEIGEYEDSTTADNNGQFHFEIDEDLLIESETILLKNDQHEIETEVESTDALVETIESDIEGECEIPEEVLEEIEDENSEQNDEASEEESIDETVEESDDEEVTEEESEEGTEESDDESGEETSVDNEESTEGNSVDSSEEVVEESEDETESDNEEERPEEENDSEESVEETPADEKEAAEDETDEVTEEERPEEENDSEESVEETPADEKEAAEDETDEVTEEERIEDESDAEESEEETPADDEEAAEDASDADSGEEPEESEDKSDEYANEDNEEMQEASAFSVSEIRQQSDIPIQPAQGSTVTVNSVEQFRDALYNTSVEVVNLATDISMFQSQNIRSNSGQKVINANGHSILIGTTQFLIEGSVNDLVVMNASNLYTSHGDLNGGMFESDGNTGTAFNLHLENVAFNADNSATGGKLGSNWEGEVHFYGNNLLNTRTGSNTLVFRKVVVHENANLEVNHQSGGGAFHFRRNISSYGDNIYGVEVHNNGRLNINSNSAVLTSNFPVNILPIRTLTYSIGEGAEVNLIGTGSNIFSLDTTMDFNINNPYSVDFQNRANNPLFNRGNDVTFNVQEASIHGWDNNSIWSDPPSYKTQTLDSINFIFDYRVLSSNDRTVVDSMNPNDSNFENEILPSIKRIMFDHSEIHTLDLEVQEISDNDTEITGSTAANAEVTLFDGEGNEINVTTSNGEGEFTFNLENPFEAGEVLSFQASYNNRDSNLVERTVVGDRLEFNEVPADIPFETTEISDEETIINRANDNLDIEIFSTRATGDWVLSAQAETALTNDEGLELNNAMYFVEDGEYELLEDEAVEVARGNLTGNEDTYTVSWGPEEGILLRLNPIYASPESEYSTTIEWTLTDGP